ncbi:NEDD8-conjugating enzyme Ubc12 [Cyclospora cayetanensis]|uniref:NEDD8-conjugating enzyme Ubc12 n=1 Tax=Cyclospora cayetanensis TaxID=88456 RepID=A0A6P6RTP5_9EIME|nr:NEDD8-conjugating enzyme Ubc12 [Cyclospora cayetanensis]
MLRLYGPGKRKASNEGVQQQAAADSEGSPPAVAGGPPPATAGGSAAAAPAAALAAPRILPSDIRLQKDLEDLDLPPNCTLRSLLPPGGGSDAGCLSMDIESERGALPTFLLTLTPDEGYWRNGRIRFTIKLPDNYPHDPPKVKCRDKASIPLARLSENGEGTGGGGGRR